MNEKYRSLVFKYARSAQIVNKDQEDEAVFLILTFKYN